MRTIRSIGQPHWLKRVGIFLIVVALVAGSVGCVPDRDPTPPPYNPEIQDWYDLDAIRYHLDQSCTLMNDLDSTTPGYAELAGPAADGGKGWEPIGPWWDRFFGSFDGQGYEISDLFINRPDENYVGLFGSVGEGAVVDNVGVVNADVTGKSYVGTLVARPHSTVSNSYATGTVTGENNVGGLVGYNSRGDVINSYSTGTVTGTDRVGGLVGRNHGTVSDSYATGSVAGEGRNVGGLAGCNSRGTASNSYATGTVTGENNVGGLVGDNYLGTVINSYSSGTVTGTDRVGGLVGQNHGTVSDSYATGSVTGDNHVGGLVGENHTGYVRNSHYNYDEVLINGQNMIAIGALLGEDFDEWLANNMFLDVNERLVEEDGYHLVHDVGDLKQLLAFGQDDSLKFRLQNDLDL